MTSGLNERGGEMPPVPERVHDHTGDIAASDHRALRGLTQFRDVLVVARS
jgi:hypothetical protein